MATSRHTHASCNAVLLVWGSLRLAPIMADLHQLIRAKIRMVSKQQHGIGTGMELEQKWNWNGIGTGMELEQEWKETRNLTHRGFIDSLCQVVLEVRNGKGDRRPGNALVAPLEMVEECSCCVCMNKCVYEQVCV